MIPFKKNSVIPFIFLKPVHIILNAMSENFYIDFNRMEK